MRMRECVHTGARSSYAARARACISFSFIGASAYVGGVFAKLWYPRRSYGAPIGACRRPRNRFATSVVTYVRVRVHFVAAARTPGVRRANNYTCPIRSTKLFAIVTRVTCN